MYSNQQIEFLRRLYKQNLGWEVIAKKYNSFFHTQKSAEALRSALRFSKESKKKSKLKVRGSRAYLVLGCAQLGVDSKVLDVWAKVAEFYDAEVAHLGPLVTLEEKKMYDNRAGRVRTWEKEADETIGELKNKTEKEIERLKTLLAETESDYRANQLEERIERLEQTYEERCDRYEDKSERLERELQDLKDAQDSRIKLLEDAFGEVTFVVNQESVFPSFWDEAVPRKYVKNDWKITKDLVLGSVPANGDRIVNNPLTHRAKRYMRNLGHSWIVPHPISAADEYPKEGINEAHSYYTTGALVKGEKPNRPSEYWKHSRDTAGIIVLVDEQSGEFHVKELFVDFLWNPQYKKKIAHIIDDGLVFTAKNVTKLNALDKANAITDAHAPFEHPGVIATFQQLNKLNPANTIISKGDTGSFESLNPHAKKRGQALPLEGMRLKNDLDGLAALYDKLRVNAPKTAKIVDIDSNHHLWLTNYIKEHAELQGILDWETLSQTKFKDIDMLMQSEKGGEEVVYKFGNYTIRHGHQESIMKGYELFIQYSCGHWHYYKRFRRAKATGAACLLGAPYLGGRITGWQNQLELFFKFRGHTVSIPRTIRHTEGNRTSRFCYRNKIYETTY